MEETGAVSSPTQESIRFDLNELFRGAIRMILELLLDEEVKAMVGDTRRLERIGSRKDHRNGSYLRRLVTSMGLIDVEMPRTRQSGSPVEVIGRYKRRTGELDGIIAQAYVQGVSTRGMGRVAESLLGSSISRSTVSRGDEDARATDRRAVHQAALRAVPLRVPRCDVPRCALGAERRKRLRPRRLRSRFQRPSAAPRHHHRSRGIGGELERAACRSCATAGSPASIS